MEVVKISKAKLLRKLDENRADHRAIFEEALAGWQAEVTDRLEAAMQDAKAGKKYRTYFNLPMPEDHTTKYDEVITRVEWHEEEFIKLSLREFNQFVRDCWDWMPDFIDSATTYSSSSSSSHSPSLSKKIKELNL